MKIYTKTGDKGKTSLGSGERIWKNSQRVNAYGTIDELNSWLGVISAEIHESEFSYKEKALLLLEIIQSDLFSIGAYLSNLQRKSGIEELKNHTEKFEKSIDEMTGELPELKNFILPGGGKVGAYFHVARSVVRRAERELVGVMLEEEIEPSVVQYVNRLSDLFFTMARYASYKDKKKEIGWKANKVIEGE